jgi:hypothetical protein
MEVAEMVHKWLEIAKAEFFVLTARFKAQRKFFMSIMIILGMFWAAYFAPLLVGLVMDALIPLTQIRVLLQVMFPGFMRAVMLLLWMFLLLIPLSHALREVKIGQWEILLANDVDTRDILVGTFLGKVPTYTLYVLFLAPLLLAPFQLAFQVSLLGQLLIYTVLTLMMLTTIWLSNIVGATIQAKLGDSPRGNDIAKAIAMLMGLITIVPVLSLQLFASQISAFLGMNVFLVFPFTWSADLVSWLAITFNGISLTTSQIANFQSILQLDLLTNGLLMTLFGVVCIGIGVLSTERLFTYGVGVRTETTKTVRHETQFLWAHNSDQSEDFIPKSPEPLQNRDGAYPSADITGPRDSRIWATLFFDVEFAFTSNQLWSRIYGHPDFFRYNVSRESKPAVDHKIISTWSFTIY